MTALSIRARLTAWFVIVLAVATIALSVAAWRLSAQSVIEAADASLQARLDGVRRFLRNPNTRLSVEGLRDEFGEYAELTRGEALLEVIGPTGAVLVRPAIPGWSVVASVPASSEATTIGARDLEIGGMPFRVASARLVAPGGAYRATVAAPMGPAYAALHRFHRLQSAVLPLVLAIAGIGGYWISRRALAPVDRITKEVQAITVQSLDRRVAEPPADDELRRLATTFNDMLSRLQSAIRDIVRFTADASHELRTPVALLRTTAEVALRRDRSPAEYREALTEILEHATRMSTLVGELLVLARTDAGLESPRGACADVGATLRDAHHDALPLAMARDVRLACDVADGPLLATGDEASLHRLLLILLDNAVRYSHPGGEVELAAAKAGGGVRITVTDAGIGLDAAEAAKVFERFYRGERARRHAPDGTGLGLAIARAIVERQHWALRLAPRAGGTPPGCRAEVLLPAAALSDPTEPGTSTPGTRRDRTPSPGTPALHG